VRESISDLIAEAGAPDAVVLAASVPTDATAAIAAGLLENGVNVLSLDSALFERAGKLAESLDAAARKGGASFMATGTQDTFWLHLPAVAAAANSAVTDVTIDDLIDTATRPYDNGRAAAAHGLSDSEFKDWVELRRRHAHVLSGPMRDLARLMSLTPSEPSVEIDALRADQPVLWKAADTIMAPGSIVGVRHEMTFETEEGPRFTGRLSFRILDDATVPMCTIVINGAVRLVLQLPNYNSPVTISMAVVRRLPEVIAASPGFISAVALRPAHYVPSDAATAGCRTATTD
jgi:4-hydroxy-tetrahydrodipicolinate reductase